MQRRVEYMTTEDEVTKYHREEDVPVVLQRKLELLQRFTHYMDNFMTEGKPYFIRFVVNFKPHELAPLSYIHRQFIDSAG